MKRILTLLTFTFLLCTVLHGQWTISQSGTTADLHDVQLTSKYIGYAVGATGVVLRTLDGGHTWSHTMKLDDEMYKGLHFFDDDNGFVVGVTGENNDEGIILKTSNGGGSWFVTSPGSHPITDIYFIDEMTGFICGHGGFVMRTIDGGNHWEQIYVPRNTAVFNEISFPNKKTGYITGNQVVLKTINGGRTWKEVKGMENQDFPYSIIETASFTSSDNGIIGGWHEPALYATNDGGENWKDVGLEDGEAFQVNKVIFPTPEIGYAAGWHGLILKSSDGGNSWAALAHPSPDINFQSASFFDENIGLFVGNGGTILRTKYGGGQPLLNQIRQQIIAHRDLLVYPNPVRDRAIVSLNYEVIDGSLLIYDRQGRLVLQNNKVNGTKLEISTADLSRGNYSFQLVEKDQVRGIGKFIVQ